MPPKKTLFDFFTKSPAVSSPLKTNSDSAQKSNKAPIDKSTTPARVLKSTPSSSNSIKENKRNREFSDDSQSDDGNEVNNSVKKKRRRIFIESEDDDDSDGYKPGKSVESSSDEDSMSGVSESESNTPEKKKKRKGNTSTPSFEHFKNQKKSERSSPKNSSPKIAALQNGHAAKSPLTNGGSNLATPKSTKNAKKSVVSDSSEQVIDNEQKEWTHETLEWLKPGKIRDKDGRPKSDPDYDPRTLHVPDKFKQSCTPAMRQWWDLKSDHFDTVLFFKVGKFYELYHMDAVAGVKELGLIFMKGDFAHSGFPEPAFGRYSDGLVEKGYKIARVEQTENPQMMQERCQKKKNLTKFDRVVAREICQITTKGTKTFTYQGEGMSTTSNFLLAISEKSVPGEDSSSEFGICFVDTSIGKFTLGQFRDDRHGSRLLTMLASYPPVEILFDKPSVSKQTLQLLNNNLTGVSKEPLNLKFRDPSKVLKFLSTSDYFKNGESFEFPETIMKMLDPDDRLLQTPKVEYELALRSLGLCIGYLKDCCIDDLLITMKQFEEYKLQDGPSAPLKTSAKEFKKHMVLDGITLQNLEIVPLLSSSDAEGTLFGTMDFCSTSFGKRLFRNWLCTPLCDPKLISERQDAVADLRDLNSECASSVDTLKKLPDLERLLSKIHAYSVNRSADHPDSRAIFYEAETYNKKKIADFLSILQGFRDANKISDIYESCTLQSNLLKACVCSDKTETGIGRFPDMEEKLEFYDKAFDHALAKSNGYIQPKKGVDENYDSAQSEIAEIKEEFDSYLNEQKCSLGCKVTYVNAGKNRYMLEVPDKVKVPSSFKCEGMKKGFKRYYTDVITKLLPRLIKAEEKLDSALQDCTRRIFAKFDDDHVVWSRAIHCLSTLDCLLSLVFYSHESEMCKPEFLLPSDTREPLLEIIEGHHPTFIKYFTGSNYIPNNVYIGPKKEDAGEDINEGGRVILVTGANMGGKSTLMRQAGTLVIMAHIGSYVPAQSMKLTPVDRIFTRVGASDHISKGESTFFVEASEVSSILHHATSDSFVLIDELGRGTATYDGTAIAYATLDYLANHVCCRSLFSTHYHSLVKDFCHHPNIGLGHMACIVEEDDLLISYDETNDKDKALQNITFLYKFVNWACPKSFGFNVALLAGITKNIVREGLLRAQCLEYSVKLSILMRKAICTKNPEQITQILEEFIKKC